MGTAQSAEIRTVKDRDTLFLRRLLQSKPALFGHLMQYPDSFQIQIVYTQINRDKANKPSFKEYSFGLNKLQYFYPASTVKMPIAFLALEKLLEMKASGITPQSTMVTDSSENGQDVVYTHPLAETSAPSIEHYIKQIFLVSDNNAYNRLYEFLGQEYIQQKLTEKGYPDAIIRHRLSVSKTPEQNQQTNPVGFYDSTGKLIVWQPGKTSKAQYPSFKALGGKGYYKTGQLIEQPFNFSDKNRIYLQDLHHILQSVLFPSAFAVMTRFNIGTEGQSFVKHWMSAYPRESKFPNYDTANNWDAYCKFLYYGSEKGELSPQIRIFNKVGDAYGFLIDISYFADFEHKVEFMLSAIISCNSDGIYNDDQYDYETVGFPFMKHLGKTIYEYELKRKKKFPADLSSFKLTY